MTGVGRGFVVGVEGESVQLKATKSFVSRKLMFHAKANCDGLWATVASQRQALTAHPPRTDEGAV